MKFWSRVDSWFCHLTIGPASHIKQYTHPTNTTTHYLLHQLTQIFPIGAIHIADCIVWSSYYTCDTLVEGLLTGNLKSSGKIALISSVCHLKNIAHFIFYWYFRHYPLSQLFFQTTPCRWHYSGDRAGNQYYLSRLWYWFCARVQWSRIHCLFLSPN